MAAPQAIRIGVTATLFALLLTFSGQPPVVTAATAVAVALLVAALQCGVQLVLRAGSQKAATDALSVRELIRHTAFLPQRDPDAAGKPRPRAPGPNPAAG